jgi:short-subunit dehydrogenase
MGHKERERTRERPLAVVTGASSGIGLEYAQRLAARGFDLALVARRRARLESTAEELRRDLGVEVKAMPTDLTGSDDLRALESFLREADRLDTLVNCAGFGTVGEFMTIDADRLEGEIALNVTALARLTRAALPGMVSRGKGTIVNVSSMACFQPNPYVAGYGATKAYVTSLTEALAAELEGTGVFVQALCPGPVKTEFGDVAGLRGETFPSFAYSTPAQVVDASLRGIERREVVCVPGTMESALASVIDVLPRWLVRRAAGGLTRRYLARSGAIEPGYREY